VFSPGCNLRIKESEKIPSYRFRCPRYCNNILYGFTNKGVFFEIVLSRVQYLPDILIVGQGRDCQFSLSDQSRVHSFSVSRTISRIVRCSSTDASDSRSVSRRESTSSGGTWLSRAKSRVKRSLAPLNQSERGTRKQHSLHYLNATLKRGYIIIEFQYTCSEPKLTRYENNRKSDSTIPHSHPFFLVPTYSLGWSVALLDGTTKRSHHQCEMSTYHKSCLPSRTCRHCEGTSTSSSFISARPPSDHPHSIPASNHFPHFFFLIRALVDISFIGFYDAKSSAKAF